MLNLDQIAMNIIHRLDKKILLGKNFSKSDTIIIVGSPRSGTTWLTEIYATIPGYMFLFEPLNPRWFPQSFEIGFRSRTYLPTDKDWFVGEDFLQKLITGQISGIIPPTHRTIHIFQSRLFGKKLIVKFVRLNRLLPWLARRIKVREMILIIRHPCAVIASQLNTGFCGYHTDNPPYSRRFPTLKDILYEIETINGLDHSLLNKIKKISTIDEILAVTWCLDQFIPLSQSKPYPWRIVMYEKLVKDSEQEIINLFNKLGEKRIPNKTIKIIKKPSLSSFRKNDLNEFVKNINFIQPDKQLSKWKNELSDKQINRILKIVSDFELDFYSNDLEPDYNKINIK